MHQDKLLSLVKEWAVGRTGLVIQEDTVLFSSGLLDSFDLLELITMLETAFDRKISAVDVNLENFDSPAQILAFLQR